MPGEAFRRQAFCQGIRAPGQEGRGRPGGPAQRPGGQRDGLLTQLPYLLVLAGVVAGLATIRSSEQAVRGGTLVIAGALLAGSLIRLILPDGPGRDACVATTAG